jgi:hypothetical protein
VATRFGELLSDLERCSDEHSVLVGRRYRRTGTLSFYRCWTPRPVSESSSMSRTLIRCTA